MDHVEACLELVKEGEADGLVDISEGGISKSGGEGDAMQVDGVAVENIDQTLEHLTSTLLEDDEKKDESSGLQGVSSDLKQK